MGSRRRSIPNDIDYGSVWSDRSEESICAPAPEGVTAGFYPCISCAGRTQPPTVEPRASLPGPAPRTPRICRNCRRRRDVEPYVPPPTSRAGASVPTLRQDGLPPSRSRHRHACRRRSHRPHRPAWSTPPARPRGSAPAQPRGGRRQSSPRQSRTCLTGQRSKATRTGGSTRPDQATRSDCGTPAAKRCRRTTTPAINQGRQELIDHVLICHALVGTLADAATIPLDVPSVGAQLQRTPRIDPPSDDRPVVAHFDL